MLLENIGDDVRKLLSGINNNASVIFQSFYSRSVIWYIADLRLYNDSELSDVVEQDRNNNHVRLS